MARDVSREELAAKTSSGDEFVLVDVLGEPYYRHSHLPGAVNLPVEEIERAQELLPNREAENIVVYRMSPIRSASEEAVRELAAMGYHNVSGYAGGKQDWIKAGLSYEGTHDTKEKS